MKLSLWSGVAVAMQSVTGTAIAIQTISKANPGVVGATSHGLANGDYVLIGDVQGMTQVNNRVFRVTGSTAGTFNLEGEDTTLYDTFVSGNAYKITFGTSFSTLLDISTSGGEASSISSTTIHDKVGTSIPGITSATEYSSNSVWDVSDAALIAAKKASDAKSQRAFMFTFSNGQRYLINGY
ncbi:MAG TPA: hypothetical protein DCO68_10180, partial [Methylophilaceae bacterium]|nr:hypothetical protein [Methylophilaceae bacterium]